MRRREFLGRSALLAAAATGLQEPAAAQAGRRVFRWAFNAAETGFDPAQVSDLYSNYVISNIIEPHEYPMFEKWQDDPVVRRWNLWSYVDSRDVALACRLGLEAAPVGADHCIVAAADTVMTRPSRDLMAENFPQVPVTRALGEFESLQSNDKARRLFGYVPRRSWRTG